VPRDLDARDGTFLFRVGKQIVSCGEKDFFRIMDQMKPTDDRRGFSDVEFETTIIPIWLVRAEWRPQLDLLLAEETGLQFIFNPNSEFIENQRLETGNSYGGVSSAAAEIANPCVPNSESGRPPCT
jgi:hypothetical protein